MPEPAAAGARPVPEDLIPHRGAARLVEAILEEHAGAVVCRGRVPPASPFAMGGRAPAVVALELAAQAAAVQRALSAADAADRGHARPGYLVAVREAVFHVDLLPVGVPLIATVRRVGGAGALAIHEAPVRFDGGGDCLRATLSTHAAV